MIERIKQYFGQGNSFYGLEIFQFQGEANYHLIHVVKKGKELEITESLEFKDFNSLMGHIKTSMPIHVSFNLDTIITRFMDAQSNLDKNAAIDKLFPGLKPEKFYFQTVAIKGCLAISICKKKEIDMYLEKFKKLNLVGLSLGTAGLYPIIEHVDQKIVYFNTKKIICAGSEGIHTIMENKDNEIYRYNINGLDLNSSDLLGFSGVLGFLSGFGPKYSNLENTIAELRSSFANNRTFNLLLPNFIFLLFFVLLINFIFFNFYNEKIKSLKSDITFDLENKEMLAKTNRRLDEKEKKISALTSLSNSKSSYFIDRLATMVPESVMFTELQYQPFQKPVQPKKSISVYENTISLSGTSSKSVDFSAWVGAIEEIPWVKSVENLHYDYIKGNVSEFKLSIYVEDIKK
ncbi:hypothetical protein GTQ34_16390 [Muricauda sp. JGD-17]|uniref:Fimbrial assembly protein PilN n=1 Tax=Flagellimonas ochracea TaxID=2696472 RepID=A0A964TEJ5_9FLAO|nr:hypothetical protein [Allomuricauda ochracea]NAY93492.1 hypothetical protein [Allomuricauda ochracea]